MKTNDLTGAVKAFRQSVTLEPDVSCLQPDVTYPHSEAPVPKGALKKEYIARRI